MPLPSPNLDDRTFDDLVKEAVSLIPRYCPEWTDHGPSDPGMTLVELFAWMTDLLIFRLNQVPEKVYVAFLEMIGVRLAPPQAARAAVTFYLARALPEAVDVPADTEVATIRTSLSGSLVFTLEGALTVRPPELAGVVTGGGASREGRFQDARRLSVDAGGLALFPEKPQTTDAFHICLAADPSHHVLAIVASCDPAAGRGIRPESPPWRWEAWTGANGWAPCVLELDTTGGFNFESGEVLLRLPRMEAREVSRVEGFWIRCVLTAAQGGSGGYEASPAIRKLTVEARGATGWARHGMVVRDEDLGLSTGRPGQRFVLAQSPVLAFDPDRGEGVTVVLADGTEQSWEEVQDFGESRPEDRHFTVDPSSGEVSFGPAVRTRHGTTKLWGAIPSRGARVVVRRYRHGGGVVGNVARHSLSILRSSIPYMTRVTNHEAAVGGLDAESLDEAKLRAPAVLRGIHRAVSRSDFEYLANNHHGVVAARCVGPGDISDSDDFVVPTGHVHVALVSSSPGDGTLCDSDTLDQVREDLERRKVVGVSLTVRSARVWEVDIEAQVHLVPGHDGADVEGALSKRLTSSFHPVTGGPDGAGWPLGGGTSTPRLGRLLLEDDRVQDVDRVRVRPVAGGGAVDRLEVPPDAMLVVRSCRVSAR